MQISTSMPTNCSKMPSRPDQDTIADDTIVRYLFTLGLLVLVGVYVLVTVFDYDIGPAFRCNDGMVEKTHTGLRGAIWFRPVEMNGIPVTCDPATFDRWEFADHWNNR